MRTKGADCRSASIKSRASGITLAGAARSQSQAISHSSPKRLARIKFHVTLQSPWRHGARSPESVWSESYYSRHSLDILCMKAFAYVNVCQVSLRSSSSAGRPQVAGWSFGPSGNELGDILEVLREAPGPRDGWRGMEDGAA